MQRSDGLQPRNGDWFHAADFPTGKVAKALSSKKGEIAVAGKVSTCIECLGKAWDDDQVFFND